MVTASRRNWPTHGFRRGRVFYGKVARRLHPTRFTELVNEDLVYSAFYSARAPGGIPRLAIHRGTLDPGATTRDAARLETARLSSVGLRDFIKLALDLHLDAVEDLRGYWHMVWCRGGDTEGDG